MTEPFVDLTVLDTSMQGNTICPFGYEDEVISELWPGTTEMCDCLDSPRFSTYYLGVRCPYTKPGGEYSQCEGVDAIPPIQQHSVNGIKVCGKRATGLSLASAVRPTKSANSGYACPTGYMACNESFLTDADLVEFAMCIPDTQTSQENCPITSFAFTLEGMDEATAAKYEEVTAFGTSSTKEFYFSKSVAAMPIDSVKVGPTEPCWNTAQLSSVPEQTFYFAEWRIME